MLSRLFLSLLIASCALAQGPTPSALPDGLILANDYKVPGPKSQRKMIRSLGGTECEGCDVTMNGVTPSPIIFTTGGGADGHGSMFLYNPDGSQAYEVIFIIEEITNGECVPGTGVPCTEEYGCTWSIPRCYIQQLNGSPPFHWWASSTPSWTGIVTPDPYLHTTVVTPDFYDLEGEVISTENPDPPTAFNCATSMLYEIWAGNTPGQGPATLLISTTVECKKCEPVGGQSMFF